MSHLAEFLCKEGHLEDRGLYHYGLNWAAGFEVTPRFGDGPSQGWRGLKGWMVEATQVDLEPGEFGISEGF